MVANKLHTPEHISIQKKYSNWTQRAYGITKICQIILQQYKLYARIKCIEFAFDRGNFFLVFFFFSLSRILNASAVAISQHGRSFALRFDAFNPISIICNSLRWWIHCVIHAPASPLQFSIYTTDSSFQVNILNYCYGFYSVFFFSGCCCCCFMNASWNC